MNRKKIILVILASVFVIVLTTFGIKTLRSNAFNIQNQLVSDDYEVIQKTYEKDIEFDLNLDNMASEVGKKIEIDDDCYLEIDSLELQNNDQYDIIFKSCGKYSNEGSVLYTGNYYNISSNDKSYIISNPTSFYSDDVKWYASSQQGISKNSDSFGYSVESSLVKNKTCKVRLKGLNKLIIKEKGN